MNNKLLTEFRHKNEVYKRWKQGQVIQQEYRATVQGCRDRARKAKAKVKLNLWRNVKDNKKGFYKYVNSKKMTRENVGPLLNGAG